VQRQFERVSTWEQKFRLGRTRCLEDNRFHLHYLSESIRAGRAEIFSDYCGWVKILLTKRGIEERHLVDNLELWIEVITEKAPGHIADVMHGYVEVAIKNLPQYPADAPEVLNPATKNPVVNDYVSRVLAYDSEAAADLVSSLAPDADALLRLYMDVLQPAQREIGRLWQVNSISVAVEHYATSTTESIIHQLSNRMQKSDTRKGILVGICPEGEFHCVGLRMICSLARLSGWQTHYIGANTPTNDAVRLVEDLQPDVIAVSITTLYSLQTASALIAQVRARAKQAKVIVGGYAVLLDPSISKFLDADEYAADAEAAIAALEGFRLTADEEVS